VRFASLGRGTGEAATVAEIARTRVAAARGCAAWTELDEADLVERGRFTVSLATDTAFTQYRGAAFGRDGTVVSDRTPLWFTVTGGGDVRVFERVPRSWSAIVYQRERRLRAVR